jgi:hypothetical protein
MEEEVKTQSQVIVGVITPAKQDKKDAEQEHLLLTNTNHPIVRRQAMSDWYS